MKQQVRWGREKKRSGREKRRKVMRMKKVREGLQRKKGYWKKKQGRVHKDKLNCDDLCVRFSAVTCSPVRVMRTRRVGRKRGRVCSVGSASVPNTSVSRSRPRKKRRCRSTASLLRIHRVHGTAGWASVVRGNFVQNLEFKARPIPKVLNDAIKLGWFSEMLRSSDA